MNGFNIWQQEMNISLSAVQEDQDSLYSFLLVGNEDTAGLLISHAVSPPQDTGKRSKILAGCTAQSSFLGKNLVVHLNRLPLFKDRKSQPRSLSTKQEKEIRDLFSKIEEVCASDYLFKKELVKIFILQLVHYQMKTDPALYRPR